MCETSTRLNSHPAPLHARQITSQTQAHRTTAASTSTRRPHTQPRHRQRGPTPKSQDPSQPTPSQFLNLNPVSQQLRAPERVMPTAQARLAQLRHLDAAGLTHARYSIHPAFVRWCVQARPCQRDKQRVHYTITTQEISYFHRLALPFWFGSNSV